MTLTWETDEIDSLNSSLYLDGYILCANVKELIEKNVSFGWYWTAGWILGIPEICTHKNPVSTQKQAQSLAIVYVKKHLPKNYKQKLKMDTNQINEVSTADQFRMLIADFPTGTEVSFKTVSHIKSGNGF